ncbi:MAG: hypothetical protein EXS36_16630 [Pedosphaera sp.]|nr:hypothetical protein [Pedosphaera sp.]
MKMFRATVIVALVCERTLSAVAASTGDSLPTADEVLKRVVERSERETDNDRQFSSHYAFTRVKQTDTKNHKGDLQKHVEKSRTNAPVVSSVTVIEPATPHPVKRSAGKAVAPREHAVDKKDFLQQADILKRFRFTVTGREQLGGRPVLVLDFVPASCNLPERDFKDPFINKAAGRVWVDEAEAVVTRADIRLTGEVRVFLGLVGMVKNGLLQFERERTQEGWWFTRLVKWHLEGRELFSRKIIDYEERKKDVHRAG